MDIVNRVNSHPLPGETIKALKTEFNPGGKGANQAVAASRAGGSVTMVGATGNDSFGAELLGNLDGENIDTEHIFQKDSLSGLAFITVDSKGQNNIILKEGANGLLHVGDLEKLLPGLSSRAAMFLLQNEIPWATSRLVIEEASKKGIPTYLNPAPAFKVQKQILASLTGIFLNETEAETLTGIKVIDIESSKKAAQLLLDAGVKEVIVTLGGKGSYYEDQSGKCVHTEAYEVNVVDTTAAGDTFIGSYLVAKHSGKPIEDSLQFATAASALAIMKEGAQKSIPHKEEIENFIHSNLNLKL